MISAPKWSEKWSTTQHSVIDQVTDTACQVVNNVCVKAKHKHFDIYCDVLIHNNILNLLALPFNAYITVILEKLTYFIPHMIVQKQISEVGSSAANSLEWWHTTKLSK